jgi:uncharacterized protein (TIGR03083 family)
VQASPVSVAEAVDLYEGVRDRVITLVEGLAVDELATAVPCTPDWSVHDVVSHLCGIAVDVLAGRLAGMGSDAWTAAQVEARRGRSTAQVVAVWRSTEYALRHRIEADPFLGVRLTGDAIVHLQDLQHALGSPIERDGAATHVAAERYVPQLQERVLDRLGIRLAVVLIDPAGHPSADGSRSGPADLTLRCDPYDFLRSVTGRRSRRQVEALDWSGDPGAVLDRAWTAYGPLPENDVAI